MQHIVRSCALMQVIDVLRYHIHVVILLKFRQREMGGIGLGLEQIAPARIVEFMHKFRIAPETIGGGNLHYGIVFPESSRVAEGGDSAFGADSRASRHYQFRFHIALYKNLIQM